MNTKQIIKPDWVFYTALFIVFAVTLFLMHKSYVYTAKAPEGIPISALVSPSYKVRESQQTAQQIQGDWDQRSKGTNSR